MVKLITIEQTRQIEAEADANGVSYAQMMDNAGYATARHAMHMLKDVSDKPRITILVGAGNNGGDGLVAGKYLAENGYEVRFYLLKRLDVTYLPYQDVVSRGLFMAYAEDDYDGRVLRHMVASADLVIDALLGIGVRLPISGDLARILRITRQAIRERKTELINPPIIQPIHPTYFSSKHAPKVLAVDCPSGVNCDTGESDDNTLKADATITFIAPKIGLVKYPAANFVGELMIAPIDIPTTLPTMKNGIGELVTGQMVKSYLPERPSESNKGTFGKVLIIGGSANYIGAMHLAGVGALRAGAGLVTIATPEPVVDKLAGNIPEPTWLPLKHTDGMLSSDAVSTVLSQIGLYDSLLIGPGIGQSLITEQFITNLFQAQGLYPNRPNISGVKPLIQHILGENAKRLDAPNLVIDADGLNILAKIDEWWTLLPPYMIITPHPGEMARLCKLTTQEVQTNRWELALEKAKLWRVIILLKGAHTVIATPEGNLSVLPFKNDALATAGTGDILAGLITGLLAGGATPYHATVAGGYIHGLAGEIAYGRYQDGRGVIAGDILACIPPAIGQLNVI
ncbi:MAG: NAD(P)H-hydrate dehydratase [Anaerolineae bacterium]|nr:NAD(P)H-hydrate dehydratase [Anaerolineae bacterium]